jgi:hypothetical protein
MQTLVNIIELSRSRDNNMPVLGRGLKLGEEYGEFTEALLHSQGLLPHKVMSEPLIGEAADVIICVLDALSGVHGDWTPELLVDQLVNQLNVKSAKWQRVMAVLSPRSAMYQSPPEASTETPLYV